MEKELTIIPPKGYEIDEEHSTFSNIKFRKIEDFPECWMDMGTISGWFINTDSEIIISPSLNTRRENRNVVSTRKLAEAFRAMMMLTQLRDKVIKEWSPNWSINWKSDQFKYVIINVSGTVKTARYNHTVCPLAFKTEMIRDKFLESYKDLLEIAKPLL